MNLKSIMDLIDELMKLEYESNDIVIPLLNKWIKFTARVSMWGYNLICPCIFNLSVWNVNPLHSKCKELCLSCPYSKIFIKIQDNFNHLNKSEQYNLIVYFSDNLYKLLKMIEKRDS